MASSCLQEGYGVNTFKLINAEGQENLCKFHVLPKEGDTPVSCLSNIYLGPKNRLGSVASWAELNEQHCMPEHPVPLQRPALL